MRKLTAQSQEGRRARVDGAGSWLAARERSDCCLLAHRVDSGWNAAETDQRCGEDDTAEALSNTNRRSRRQKHNSIKTKFKVLLNRGKP